MRKKHLGSIFHCIFQFYVPSLDLFLRKTVSQCLWTYAFICWPLFWVWNALVKIIFTVWNFSISKMSLPSRKKMGFTYPKPTDACQVCRFVVNSYDEHVLQGGSLVHLLCSMVSWRLWERCQRARLCGGWKGRTEYDRQFLQWADHQELGGEYAKES